MTSTAPAINRSDIRTLIDRFYRDVRRDPRLGPIFHRHIGTTDEDWAGHLAKIENFWANVLLHERCYNGNPMQVHSAVPEIQGEDFDRWLAIFDRAASSTLPAGTDEAVRDVAHRIGRSLKMGLARMRETGPPRLAG